MLGALIGELAREKFERTGEIPEEDGLIEGETRIGPGMVRLLGMAKALADCDAPQSDLGSEAAYWIGELLDEYAWEEDAEGAGSSCTWAAPIGAASGSSEQAEELAALVSAEFGESEEDARDAAALAGAMCLAWDGADKEKIASYILAKELSPVSASARGAAALLKADDLPGAVTTALASGLGVGAACAAAALAEPLFGIDEDLAGDAYDVLPHDLKTVFEEYSEHALVHRAQ